MKKRKLFIDMYGVSDVYSLNTFIICPETELSRRKEYNHLFSLPFTEKTEELIWENLNQKTSPVILSVESHCHLIFSNCSIQTLRKLSELYEFNFLSTPFRDFPNKFPEAYRWFEKRTEVLFVDKLVLSSRNDLSIDYFMQNESLFDENENFKQLHILFEDDVFPHIRDFIYSNDL